MTTANMVVIVGFNTTSVSGGETNDHEWFDYTILCSNSKNKVCLEYLHAERKSKTTHIIEGDEVTGSFSSSSDPIDIPLVRHSNRCEKRCRQI